jgi:hypothetical protein
VRLGGLVTLIGGLALSAIPGPKGSSHIQITETEHGVTTVTRKFTYHQPYGVPFTVVRTEFEESGESRSVRVDGKEALGFIGNLAIALGIVVVFSMLVSRARRRPA